MMSAPHLRGHVDIEINNIKNAFAVSRVSNFLPSGAFFFLFDWIAKNCDESFVRAVMSLFTCVKIQGVFCLR